MNVASASRFPDKKIPIQQLPSEMGRMNVANILNTALLLGTFPIRTYFSNSVSGLVFKSIATLAIGYLNQQLIWAIHEIAAPWVNRCALYLEAGQTELTEVEKHEEQQALFTKTVGRLRSPLSVMSPEYFEDFMEQKCERPFAGVSHEFLRAEDGLPKEKGDCILLLNRQIALLHLFFEEEEMRDEKTKGFLAVANSLESPTSRLCLVAGCVALIGVELLHCMFRTYLLDYLSFSLKGVAAFGCTLGAIHLTSSSTLAIWKWTKLDHLMHLQECAKTFPLYKNKLLDWQARFDSYQKQLKEKEGDATDFNISGHITDINIFKDKIDARERAFHISVEKLGWIGSRFFTTSAARPLWKELFSPDPIPFLLPNPRN